MMNKVKIDIISGFLGAGKTTFIKKLMEGVFQDEKVVILENEFGKVNIDLETLEMAGLRVKPIQAGCICCSSSQELQTGILEILTEFEPDRIIVEPTGIAKLSEIIDIFKNGNLSKQCIVEHIITIVDSKNYYLRTLISKVFFEDQIRASEVIFLSKTNHMSEEQIFKIIAEIYKIKPSCRIISDPWDGISIDQLKKRIAPWEDIKEPSVTRLSLRINHINDFESYEYSKNEYVNIDKIKRFIQCVENSIYGEVHRLKGICRDKQYGPYSIDYVPGETVIKFLPHHQKKEDTSIICIIGRNMEPKKLNRYFKT